MIAKRSFVILMLMVLLVVPVVFTGCSGDSEEKEEPILSEEQRKLNLESFDKVWTTIHDKHYDPGFGGLDWQAVHDELRPKMEKALKMSEARAILKDMIGRLKLSHFNLIPDEVYKKLGKPGEKGASDGVTGIDVRVVAGHALVTAVREGSPAHKAGVKPGWEITQINEVETASLLPDISKEFEGNSMKAFYLSYSVQARLYGEIGSSKKISFLDGNNKTVQLDISLEEEKGNKFKLGHLPPMHIWIDSRTIEGETGNIGYITFNGFLDIPRVMPAFNNAMKSFIDAGVHGVVIDIRGNGGGLPIMAMGMAGWLIEETGLRLGTMFFRNNELKIVVRPRPEVYAGSVAVLVDGMSASCSEIFAGGLQDLGRARIFGSTTAGAVLPSTVEKLANSDGFQYAFANYRSEKGAVLEGVGVVPDVEVYPTREALLRGKDLVLETAIRWIGEQKETKKNDN
ncbi:MAG: hypothetical protein GY950_09530 [bacterium]|nr:hypothetical protein [bacterium]